MSDSKRIKEDEQQIENDFDYLETKLSGNCYCDISITVPKRILRFIHTEYWEHIQSAWPRNRILTFLACIELICVSIRKQYCEGSTCRNIPKLRKIITERRNQLIEFLIRIINIQDQFVIFASIRALTSYFILLDTKVEQWWIEKLCEYINEEPPESTLMCFSLNILKNIMEWKSFSEHILEENDKNNEDIKCGSTNVISEPFDCVKLKSNCIKSLCSRWASVAYNFSKIIQSENHNCQSNIITFLNLWQGLVSVNSDHKVRTTEYFYRDLQCFVPSKPNTISSVIWKHLLDVFNEVLCYGSTLALQGDVDKNTRQLTIAIVNRVKNGQLLNFIPCSVGNDVLIGCPIEGYDKVLIKKATLMVIKAVAVTVREAKTDSSSDSSVASVDDDIDQDMKVIERNVYEVLKKLDTFVKSYSAFHPETKISQWIVQLFVDQDDCLIESMVCCLDVSSGLCYRNSSILELRKILDPCVTFIAFLEAIRFDHSMILEFLMSTETCFLLYFYRILKYIKRNPEELIKSCHEKDSSANVLLQVYEVIETLKISIELLVKTKHFPYHIDPVLNYLKACEELIRMFIS